MADFSPPDDPNLIVSVHYYDPFAFTHQGAPWLDPPFPIHTLWDGTRIRFAGDWENWSWDTNCDSTSEGLKVTFEAPGVGLRFHHPVGVHGANKLIFMLDEPLSLKIVSTGLNEVGGEAILETKEGMETYSVDLPAEAGTITDVTFQNMTDKSAIHFLMKEVRLVGDNIKVDLLETESETLKKSFQSAANWGIEHKLPMHLGEFGTFYLADRDSRVRWTKAVRQECDALGIDWTYWDLAAHFGIYDPGKGAWRRAIVKSLIPEFGK